MFENLNWSDLQSCVADRWTPQIGDPNLTGWLTVLAYAACMVLAALVWRRSPKGAERAFWGVLALLMAALAVNKQLDLQSALTATGRCIAKMQGWYEDRRGVQVLFIEGVLIVAVLALIFGLYRMRKDIRRNGVAIIGLHVVVGFVAVRAVGFHHFDTLINTRVMDVRFNFIFENSGLVLIALNAVTLLMQPVRRA